jgi:hypothetical protein
VNQVCGPPLALVYFRTWLSDSALLKGVVAIANDYLSLTSRRDGWQLILRHVSFCVMP